MIKSFKKAVNINGTASIADGTIDRSGRTKSRDILRHKHSRDAGRIIICDAPAI